jgi:hypothetical protein
LFYCVLCFACTRLQLWDNFVVTDSFDVLKSLGIPCSRRASAFDLGGIRFSVLKRSLGGTYISVELFHLDAYVAEQVFSYNNRKDADDFARFATRMMGIQDKPLTYQALTQRPGVN